jgi:hypothetical protein
MLDVDDSRGRNATSLASPAEPGPAQCVVIRCRPEVTGLSTNEHERLLVLNPDSTEITSPKIGSNSHRAGASICTAWPGAILPAYTTPGRPAGEFAPGQRTHAVVQPSPAAAPPERPSRRSTRTAVRSWLADTDVVGKTMRPMPSNRPPDLGSLPSLFSPMGSIEAANHTSRRRSGPRTRGRAVREISPGAHG